MKPLQTQGTSLRRAPATVPNGSDDQEKREPEPTSLKLAKQPLPVGVSRIPTRVQEFRGAELGEEKHVPFDVSAASHWAVGREPTGDHDPYRGPPATSSKPGTTGRSLEAQCEHVAAQFRYLDDEPERVCSQLAVEWVQLERLTGMHRVATAATLLIATNRYSHDLDDASRNIRTRAWHFLITTPQWMSDVPEAIWCEPGLFKSLSADQIVNLVVVRKQQLLQALEDVPKHLSSSPHPELTQDQVKGVVRTVFRDELDALHDVGLRIGLSARLIERFSVPGAVPKHLALMAGLIECILNDINSELDTGDIIDKAEEIEKLPQPIRDSLFRELGCALIKQKSLCFQDCAHEPELRAAILHIFCALQSKTGRTVVEAQALWATMAHISWNELPRREDIKPEYVKACLNPAEQFGRAELSNEQLVLLVAYHRMESSISYDANDRATRASRWKDFQSGPLIRHLESLPLHRLMDFRKQFFESLLYGPASAARGYVYLKDQLPVLVTRTLADRLKDAYSKLSVPKRIELQSSLLQDAILNPGARMDAFILFGNMVDEWASQGPEYAQGMLSTMIRFLDGWPSKYVLPADREKIYRWDAEKLNQLGNEVYEIAEGSYLQTLCHRLMGQLPAMLRWSVNSAQNKELVRRAFEVHAEWGAYPISTEAWQALKVDKDESLVNIALTGLMTRLSGLANRTGSNPVSNKGAVVNGHRLVFRAQDVTGQYLHDITNLKGSALIAALKLVAKEGNQSESAVLEIRSRAFEANLTHSELQDVMDSFSDEIKSSGTWIESTSIVRYSFDQAARMAESLFK